MNVLLLIPSINPAQGGPVVVLQQFARYQTRDGDRLQVVSFDEPEDAWVKRFEYPLVPLGPCGTFYGYTPRMTRWLREHAREYDVVVVHGIWQYHSLAAWRALAGGETPYVIYTHGMLDPGHHKVSRLRQMKKQIYWLLAERSVVRDAAAVFFTMEEERRIAPEGVWPVRWNHSELVPCGVEAPSETEAGQGERFLERFPTLRGKRVLLFLGRFDPKKGGRLLMKAFARMAEAHPEVTLVMVGPEDGEEGRHLKGCVPERLKERVLWTGLMLGEDKWAAFRAAEAFIIPSHTENYCIAAVEALACGVPVLMSDKVNIHREVSAHEAGYVENDDEEGTLRLIERWLATPAGKWADMRVRAAACYRKEFQMEDAYAAYRAALSRAAGAADGKTGGV